MGTDKTYTVRVRAPFTATKRVRAGVEVSAADGYTGPLTAEQLKAIKADACLVVTTGEPEQGVPTDSLTEATKVLNAAKAEAKAIVDAAKKQAEAIVAKANEAAGKATDAAKKQAEQK